MKCGRNGIIALCLFVLIAAGAASGTTYYYVDPDYAGGNGTAAKPWASLAVRPVRPNNSFVNDDVTVYFSAREVSSDISETRSGWVQVSRTDTGTHRLRLDGMSKYNTNDAAPPQKRHCTESQQRQRRRFGDAFKQVCPSDVFHPTNHVIRSAN